MPAALGVFTEPDKRERQCCVVTIPVVKLRPPELTVFSQTLTTRKEKGYIAWDPLPYRFASLHHSLPVSSAQILKLHSFIPRAEFSDVFVRLRSSK